MPKRTYDGLRKRCDCGPRKWAKCLHPWHFSFYHAHREYRCSLDVVARARNEQPPVGTTEAKAWRDKLRGEIRGGADPTTPPLPTPPLPTPTDATRLTVGDVMDRYLDQHVRAPERKKAGQVVMTAYINRLRAMHLPAAHGTTLTLAQKTLDTVTAADLDVLRRGWTLEQTAAQGGRTGPNRALKRLRHFFNWAIEQGYTERSPFKRGHVNTVHFPSEAGRTRRLEGDEEKQLLEHAATPLMRVLISAGLETGCRIGELLLLTWADVKWNQSVLLLPAEITKSGKPRDIPLTQNLSALLEMRRHAPDGQEHAADRFVFGNEVGEPVKYWRVNQAWHATCEAAGIVWHKAYGIEGLNFHDLRRELASTLRESGAPDHIVADVLGHANISTTSRYLQASRAGLKHYMLRLEEHRHETAEQKKEAARRQKRQRAKAGRIRTLFAHDAAQGQVSAAERTAKNRAKSLN